MNFNTMKCHYSWIIQLSLILYFSSNGAGDRGVEPSVQISPTNQQQRHHIPSILLAHGIVPIIISKPISDPGDKSEEAIADIPKASDGGSYPVTIANNSLRLLNDISDERNTTGIAVKNVSEAIIPLLTRITSVAVALGPGALASKPAKPAAIPVPPSSSLSNSFNILDVIAPLDVRLKHIRNLELGVTYVQEIFDAMSYTNAHTSEETITNLASRIRSKIEVVHDILDNLSEFIGSNISLTLRQQQDGSSNTVFLNTLIQPCPFDDFTLEQNYNKKQIQILNYLKISGFRDVDDLNFTINTQIVNALRRTATANTFVNPFSTELPLMSKASMYNSSTTDTRDSESAVPLPAQSLTSNFKHVFFLSRNDHASDHNCQYYFNDLNFRHLYVSAIRHKHVFLVVEYGNSLSSEQLDLSKQFVSNIIQILQGHDTISIVLIDDHAEVIRLNSHEDETFRYEATMDRKDELQRLIALLTPSKQTTNHSLAFEYAFELLLRQNVSKETPLVFIYVSRGLLSRFTEAMTVLDTVAKGQAKLDEPVVINTCAVILDEKRIMYEKQFLQDIAQQNYSKYNINVSSWYHSDRHKLRGNMFVITKRHPELIVKTSTSVFGTLFKPKYVTEEIKYHLPVLDYNTKDVIVSITKPIPKYGLAGVNMYLNDLAEDIIYYHKTSDSYAFLIDTDGMVIYHPAFKRPIATSKTPYPVEISFLEPALLLGTRSDVNDSLLSALLSRQAGNETTSVSRNGGMQNITYAWSRILNAYVVCIVTITRMGNDSLAQWKTRGGSSSVHTAADGPSYERYKHRIEPTPSSELLYHRIDLIPPPKTPICRHFRQIATLETGTIFLSASAFKSPFIYFKNNREIKDETQRTHNAQSIMAYIKDMTNLLANPGLQSQIRSDVSALLRVMTYLKKRHMENGALKKYIIRRYIATTNGVLQVYPGCILGTDLEPTRRSWFRKAVRHPGRIVVTEPYLDAGGAGYIVTIAHTIFEGKANALHNADRDLPIGVVALDVPYAFFYKMLLESAPLCSEPNIKCLLVEDVGYLVAHPSMMEPSTVAMNNRRPFEHITHKESFVANDILNHKILVRKKACATFQSRIIQRYYEFNTSLTKVLTNNVVHGERTKYQITTIPGTNIFAAILNSTCDGGAFCPCSTVDRICLNCNRMDQVDCECPCECPLNINDNFKTSYRTGNNTTLEYCEPETEGLSVVNSLSYDWSLVVKSCVNINCEIYTTHTECLGVMGCEWCQLDVDMNPFATPFCTAQNSCFNGLLGSATPYGDGDLGSSIIEPATAPAYSAIGPVGGTIIALCLMVGFAMYCYRQNFDNSSEHLYGMDSMQDENYGVPLSRLFFDDITPQDDNDLSGGGGAISGTMMHRNLIHPLANAINVNDISPYHMSTGGYRRPANGESDHGYSTMTPHEDSEHMCFTLVEPLINHKSLSMSADSMSINTSVSSPINHPVSKPYLHSQHIEGPSNILTIMGPNQLSPETQTTAATPLVKLNLDRSPNQTLLSFHPPSDPSQTVIPPDGFQASISSHHILAPVTVHRDMEAS